MLKKKMFIWMVLLLLVGLSWGCDQVDDANKLVNEANALITKSNELATKSNKLMTELLGENWTKAEDNEAYKTENKSKFDELISLNEQIEKLGNESAEKFDQASKLKLNDKFKEYLSLKSQELKKRSEGDKLVVPFVKKFLETKDIDQMNKQIEENNKKSADIGKEADVMLKKVDQFTKDNPDIFKN